MRVYVGPGVLGLALLSEHGRSNSVKLLDELDQRIVGQVFFSKLGLRGEARVGFPQDSMAVTRDDLQMIYQSSLLFGGRASRHSQQCGSLAETKQTRKASYLTRVEKVPEGLLELIVGDIAAAKLLPQLGDEPEDFLVGQAVERTGEAVHASGEGEVGIGEGTADKVSGMGGHVATLVVRVEDEVEPQELHKLAVLKAKLVGKVGAHIDGGVGGDGLAAVIGVAVNLRSGPGQEGDEVEHVLVGELPVLGLVDAFGVGLGELALGLQSVDADAELAHGVHACGQILEDVRDMGGKLLRAFCDFVDEGLGLFTCGDLACQKKPQESLRERLLAALGLGELGLALWDGIATEADALGTKCRTENLRSSRELRRMNGEHTSSGSRREVSVTRPLMPRIPP